MKRYILTLIIAIIPQLTLLAQDSFVRGLMAVQNNDIGQAQFYLQKALDEDPTLGYCHALLGYVYNTSGHVDSALVECNRALKYLSKNESDARHIALYNKALALAKIAHIEPDENQKRALESTAIENLNFAISIKPDVHGFGLRSRLYRQLGMFEEALKDCNNALTLIPDNDLMLQNIGEIYSDMGKNSLAINFFSKAFQKNNNNYEALIMRGYEYLRLSMHRNFVNDMLAAFARGGAEKALSILAVLQDEPDVNKALYKEIENRLENTPKGSGWGRLAGLLSKHRNDYFNAIRYFQFDLNEKNKDILSPTIAECYMGLGAYEEGLKLYESVTNISSLNRAYIHTMILLYGGVGNYEKALEMVNWSISLEPDSYYGYYLRGVFYREMGELEKAKDSFSMAISLAPQEPYSYLSRGKIYLEQGETESANNDFHAVLNIENNLESTRYKCSQYAQLFLGNKTDAIERCQSILSLVNDDGNNYDAACLYSLMGDKQNALDYFEIALEKGFRDFLHIERDSDLDNIRNERRFIKLVDKYKAMRDENVKALM